MSGIDIRHAHSLPIDQARQAAMAFLRPNSRKYDLAEHEYPKELDLLASLIDGMADSGEGQGAGATGVRRDEGAEDDGTDPWAPFDALSAAAAGHAWYEDAGWARTSVRYREGVDHFELPEARVLDAAMTAGESPAERSAELSPAPSAEPPRGAAADGRD